VVTPELLDARRTAVRQAPDLRRLATHLVERARPLLARAPIVPAAKSLLSQDGGRCPADGATLTFDPWSPDVHRCPRCGAAVRGERHDRWWARYQHQWNAERAAHLATVAAFGDLPQAADAARDLLGTYGERYFSYPNRDNVLGPARLTFSTYLESIWISNYLAAAVLLRAAGLLDQATERRVTQLADEAANLIGEFDERYSNRQTWNNAALAAIGTWFGDGELMHHAVEGTTGLVVHLVEGFRPDGMWYEGENYHLFALRGLLTGLVWARVAGVDVTTVAALEQRLAAALLAPTRTALPDLSFPARKDSRFGVSLAQPMYLDTWEVGLGLLGDRASSAAARAELGRWLGRLYATPAPEPELIDCYLHDAEGGAAPGGGARRREALSWLALLTMPPDSAPNEGEWRPQSMLLDDQGLAVLRTGERYASVECGPYAGGHAHADRLHLTLHDGTVHWLPDPGTGSYVGRDLFWYRGTLAHNAPRLDGRDQLRESAQCVAFDEQGGWSWAVGTFGPVTRSLISGPSYLLDLVELSDAEDHTMDLPWHFAGECSMLTPGTWGTAELDSEFASDGRAFVSEESAGPLTVRAEATGARLTAWFLGGGQLLDAAVPGAPGATSTRMLVRRARGRNARLLTVLVPGDDAAVQGVRWSGDVIEVETATGTERHRASGATWAVETPAGTVRLAGTRPVRTPFTPFLVLEPHDPVQAPALAIAEPPPVDGSLTGFDLSEPFTLELEDQYRRSEEPFPGPDELSARAWANWTDEALFLAVEVVKRDPWFRPSDAPPLRLDNEPDDVHSDGLQVFLREREGRGVAGFLIVPEPGGALRVRLAGTVEGEAPRLSGAWREIEVGYRVTLRLEWPEWLRPHPGGRIGFDLHVNEMYPERERRAGQLAWSGGNGWVYLRGDRQDPDRLGRLELVG